MGPYWWPDPENEDGLPYIRSDGEINPEYYDYKDKEELGKLMDSLKTLSEAYFFSEEEAYAAHAIGSMRTWFLDPETKTNVHGNNHTTWYFAQIIPLTLYLDQKDRADSLAKAGLPLIIGEMIEKSD